MYQGKRLAMIDSRHLFVANLVQEVFAIHSFVIHGFAMRGLLNLENLRILL